MTLLSCKYDIQDRGVEIDEDRNRTYTLRWRAITDNLSEVGIQVLMQCINTSSPNDPVPVFGAAYAVNGVVLDSGSYAQKISCKLEDSEVPFSTGTASNVPIIWIIEVEFAPPRNDSENERERLSKPNPLDWNTEYWIEWVEEQVPVEEATCHTDLPTIMRGPSHILSGPGEPGPVVNAAGQQTIDPLTKPEFHPVLCAKKNYRYGHVANVLNQLFRDTVNDDDFLGDPVGSWRFMTAEAEKEKTHYPFEDTSIGTGPIVYVPITVKLEFKKWRYVNRIGTGTGEEGAQIAFGWDRVILNNGQLCFKRFEVDDQDFIFDPRAVGDVPMLFPTLAYTLREDFDFSLGIQPTLDDIIEVESAEPMNLKTDGTQITVPEVKGNHIIYSHYQFADYTLDEYDSGSNEIGNIASPWKELLDQYATLYP